VDTEKGIYLLLGCPAGHKVVNASSPDGQFSHDSQACQVCGKGEECRDESCVTCSLCQPGKYKAAVSTDPCVACPANTYRETTGASDLGMCLACQAKSSTNGTGLSSRRACECDIEYYLITTDQGLATESLLCQPCPKGGVCANGECALRNADLSCSDGSSIVGTWILNNQTRQFDLVACPAGYEQRTTAEMGSADLQICHECLATQYIISDTDLCRDCPAGLRCQRDAVVVPLVEKSTWLAEDGIYKLSTCPTGYEKIRVDGQWVQQKCEPCPKGSHCTLEACEMCTECAPGYYKAAVGTEACAKCPINTFRKDPGATALDNCEACPTGADTRGKTAMTTLDDCKCSDRLYSYATAEEPLKCSTCPRGAVCLVRICDIRSRSAARA